MKISHWQNNLWHSKDVWNCKWLSTMCSSKKCMISSNVVLCVCTFTCITYFILTVALWIWNYYPYFISEKFEAERGSNLWYFMASVYQGWSHHEGLGISLVVFLLCWKRESVGSELLVGHLSRQNHWMLELCSLWPKKLSLQI